VDVVPVLLPALGFFTLNDLGGLLSSTCFSPVAIGDDNVKPKPNPDASVAVDTAEEAQVLVAL